MCSPPTHPTVADEEPTVIFNGKLVPVHQTTGKKFYIVVKGRMPGIYRSWPECEAQVCRFSGNVYESFSTYEKAADEMKKAGAGYFIPRKPCDLSCLMSKASLESSSSDSDSSNGGSSIKSKGKKPARDYTTAKTEGGKSTDGDTLAGSQKKKTTDNDAPANKSRQACEPEPAQNPPAEDSAKGKGGKGKVNAGTGLHRHGYNTRSKKATDQIPTMQANVLAS